MSVSSKTTRKVKMKGIILAGGSGSRLHPVTSSISKQLAPIYNKPMVYYPLSTLIGAGISEILLISTPKDLPLFENLLGDGSEFGVHISFAAQEKPSGLAEVFIIGESFIGSSSVALVLGDNLFFGTGVGTSLERFKDISGAGIFGYWVSDPSSYGVIEFDSERRPKALVEKPKSPPSNFAIPGLYFYDSQVVEFAKTLSPSSRGELEITDLNNIYLSKSLLKVEILPRGTAWLDTGTFDSMAEATEFVRIVEKRQGLIIGSPHEMAWRKGFIDTQALLNIANKFGKSAYGSALREIVERELEND